MFEEKKALPLKRAPLALRESRFPKKKKGWKHLFFFQKSTILALDKHYFSSWRAISPDKKMLKTVLTFLALLGSQIGIEHVEFGAIFERRAVFFLSQDSSLLTWRAKSDPNWGGGFQQQYTGLHFQKAYVLPLSNLIPNLVMAFTKK